MAGGATVAVGQAPNSVAVADFNLNGKFDLVSVSPAENNASVAQGDGMLGFYSPVVGVTGTETGAFPVTADFNGDGLNDEANIRSGQLFIRTSNGNGTFASSLFPVIISSAEYLFAADFNRDGKIDLATANGGAGNVSILINNGAGSFNTPASFSVGGVVRSLVVGDYNLDGGHQSAPSGCGRFQSRWQARSGCDEHERDFHCDGRRDGRVQPGG